MFERSVKEATRVLHVIAAIWLCLIATMIVIDVGGRFFLNAPLRGTAEIVANSIVAIAFLQIPFAIRTYGMLRTTVVLNAIGATGRRILNVATYLLGIVLFLIIAEASIDVMMRSWRIGEYQGEGALRVPVYPVRTIIVALSVVAAIAYLLLLVKEIRGTSEEQADTVSY